MDIKIGDEIIHRFFGRGRVKSVNVKGAYISVGYPDDQKTQPPFYKTHALPSASWVKVEA